MVQPDGLRAVKGVHSLGWAGWWKRAGGNQDSCRRIPVVMYLCFGAESAYVFMVFGARVPMYLYLGGNAYVLILGY
jgi:hypothetical protein